MRAAATPWTSRWTARPRASSRAGETPRSTSATGSARWRRCRDRASTAACTRSSGVWPNRALGYLHLMERKWWTLVAVCVATFMLLLDITIVNVALPEIERALDASFSDLQWVIDAYALTLAALLLTGGSVSDLVGRRRIFVVGIAIFTVASLLCALAG